MDTVSKAPATSSSRVYNLQLFRFERLPGREVEIGEVPMGGENPIRVQSMTTTDTMDTAGTVAQSLRMVESGAEYVRITAPSIKEAKNLENIRAELRELGQKVPLVADIHYTPNAAEKAARIVEKVRVNPGNYADKKKFEVLEYTDEAYQAEIDRIEKRFTPLVLICKEEGTAMRIGTNHGSLSDRIMSHYGDTPLGMVESALEFLRICEKNDYRDIVISMKASNPQVMVQAYRLLVQKSLERGEMYPLHLGVTEAGEGEDGRIKSALGISALLLDGIGDTVRVSLTEEPEYESPVAQFLVNYAVAPRTEFPGLPEMKDWAEEVPVDPFAFHRRKTKEVANFGGDQVPRVFADFSHKELSREDLTAVGYHYAAGLDKYNFSDMAADYIFLGTRKPGFVLPGGLKQVYEAEAWTASGQSRESFPLFAAPAGFLKAEARHGELNFVGLRSPEEVEAVLSQPDAFGQVVFVAENHSRQAPYFFRYVAYRFLNAGLEQPLMYRTDVPDSYDFYADSHLPEQYQLTEDAKAQLYLASQLSFLAVDGLVDGLWMGPGSALTNRTAFGILQAGRLRITKTEYISCPSCGRTLFDLQETTAKIRKRTEHLKGVKIGIMGCIVNGPGEMADADYGYVGVGPGKIALYRGQEVVERGVKTEFAVDKLIDLIRTDGRWIEQ